MRRIAGVALCLLLAGCGENPHADSNPPSVMASPEVGPLTVDRRILFDDVVEYDARLQVGPGIHDVIGLHRVVREREPWSPILASRAVFLVPGSAQEFRTAFAFAVDSPLPDDHALAVFLAQNDLDVWGIDVRWALLTPDLTADPAAPDPADFQYMEDWDMGTYAGDIRTGLAVARHTRTAEGSGSGPLILLGFSMGATFGFAVVGEESQLPAGDRDVSGYVAIETALKLDDEEQRLTECQRYEALRNDLEESGLYVNNTDFQRSGALAARDAPDETSPFPPITNRQGAIIAWGAYFLVSQMLYEDLPLTACYHDYGGSFEEVGPIYLPWIPTEFVFTDEAVVWEVGAAMRPFVGRSDLLDLLAMRCDDPAVVDVPWDDHLSEIEIPVLYVGAAGAFGSSGLTTTSLLASPDNTSLIVEGDAPLPENSSCPPQDFPFPREACSFGHSDMLYARDAPELVWQPILDWIIIH